MMNKRLHKLRQIKDSLRSDKGSFTIEASMVFPIVFLLVLSLVFVSIVIYEKASLYYIASCTAERATYNWNNSFKNLSTGEFALGEYESSLYWRLTDDRIFDSLLNLSNDFQPIEVTIKEDYGLGYSLPGKKMMLLADNIPKNLSGRIIYQNSIQRGIIVELESSMKVPSFVTALIGQKIVERAYSTVTEPVEFIRTIDFLMGYSYIVSENKEKVTNILKKEQAKEQNK
ncbi:MAG: TadE/TadG family type IV pilus assembly protein [Vulcanibacillus sp.]